MFDGPVFDPTSFFLCLSLLFFAMAIILLFNQGFGRGNGHEGVRMCVRTLTWHLSYF